MILKWKDGFLSFLRSRILVNRQLCQLKTKLSCSLLNWVTTCNDHACNTVFKVLVCWRVANHYSLIFPINCRRFVLISHRWYDRVFVFNADFIDIELIFSSKYIFLCADSIIKHCSAYRRRRNPVFQIESNKSRITVNKQHLLSQQYTMLYLKRIKKLKSPCYDRDRSTTSCNSGV